MITFVISITKLQNHFKTRLLFLTMIQFQNEKTTREAEVSAQYPAYYRGYVYNSYCVAVLSDTLAIKVSVVPTDLFVRKGTPAEAFRLPGIEDFELIGEGKFLEALQKVLNGLKAVARRLNASRIRNDHML